MKEKYRKYAVLPALLLFGASAFAAGLSRKTSTAVIVTGESSLQAANILTRELLKKGFRVVDRKRLSAYLREKADILALSNDVEGIKRLARKHGIGQFVNGEVKVDYPCLNEFELYTSGATISVRATAANGALLFADAQRAKKVGYTGDEAIAESVTAAAEQIAQSMTGGRASAGAGAGPLTIAIQGASCFADVRNVVGRCRFTYGVDSANARASSGGNFSVEVRGSYDLNDLIRSLSEISSAQVRQTDRDRLVVRYF